MIFNPFNNYYKTTSDNVPLVVSIFYSLSGLLLLFVSTAKFISASGNAGILENNDPVLGIAFRNLFFIVGVNELLVAFICFFVKHTLWQSLFIASLATNIALYRIGMLWVGYHKACPCLGNLTDALHIAPQTAGTAMKIILVFLLIGSYASLFWMWWQKRRAATLAAPLPGRPTGAAS